MARYNVQPAAVKSSLLNWISPPANGGDEPGEWATQPNIQRIPAGGRVIEVQMGSIHAVKGETHFGTLVLETHNHKHSLKSLLPWLLEDASGPSDARGKPIGLQQSKRLRLYYVALTRSTHIICLAIPQAALGEAVERDHRIARLRGRFAGWCPFRLLGWVWRPGWRAAGGAMDVAERTTRARSRRGCRG
jgi:hypothetical protein